MKDKTETNTEGTRWEDRHGREGTKTQVQDDKRIPEETEQTNKNTGTEGAKKTKRENIASRETERIGDQKREYRENERETALPSSLSHHLQNQACSFCFVICIWHSANVILITFALCTSCVNSSGILKGW
jgi:hypothetical protein